MDWLYNQTYAGFTGTAVRPTFRNRHPDDISVYARFDKQGKWEGYVRAFSDEQNPKDWGFGLQRTRSDLQLNRTV